MPYRIGATEVGLTDLQSLTVPVEYPKGKENFDPYAFYKIDGDGRRKGYGLPKTRWDWGVITQEERDQLETFFTTGSDIIFISTRLPDGSYADYQCRANWPSGKEKVFGGGYLQSFFIYFEYMVAL